MKPDEAVREMAARLSAVDWERRGDKAWSKAALLKEYFRRAARLADACECDTRTPFFDIAGCVHPGVQLDQSVLDETLQNVQAGGWDITNLTPFILRWAALRATPGVELPADLEDPFAPLLVLFERGGGFHTENGEVNLEWKSVRLAGWRRRATDPALPSFGADDLDEIDRAGSMAQFGYVMGPDGEPSGQ
ncbi:hypothetical protein [Winogradskya humida]|uniref:Uncharacterized protein n=1 Tax=Winogradskya humida TaxID=113566 RepID=A0ABQ3ZZJ7_9ACTN|nr:hypothetical protein [Actinoplanes humidus]GIE23527.1 hypothetical protein Ahu01nite_066290 [Actinoplanes humidus]